jgi:hypothetical protein
VTRLCKRRPLNGTELRKRPTGTIQADERCPKQLSKRRHDGAGVSRPFATHPRLPLLTIRSVISRYLEVVARYIKHGRFHPPPKWPLVPLTNREHEHMPAFRVYFLNDKSIIGADWIEAETSTDAVRCAKHSLGSGDWPSKPNGLEVWRGTEFHCAAPLT